jgi:two-component system phosphate regulon sensor histidine kinase PhoR
MVWLVLILCVLSVGTVVCLHIWWRGTFARLEDDSRKEIEKLRQAQQQATTQIQTQQEAVLNSMTEGLLLLDDSGRIQLANRAFADLFGVSQNLKSRTILEALRIHELAELVDFLGTEKRVVGYELKVTRPEERWLQVNGAAIMNGDGQRHGAILVFHDHTRLKKLERTRQEFVANVSHELRTPLSLIKGYVETLLDGARNNPEVAVRFLQTIERNAERLNLLIEDLLVISELESGRVQLNLQTVALQPAVDKVIEDYKARAGQKDIQLINEAPALSVNADPNRLGQVLGNLVDNAIKYGRNEGVVRVGAQTMPPGFIEVFVRDDGPGIPADALERVFERFFRVDKARSREQGGTGLGLSIVKHLVQTQGGRVWAKSELGHGAAFFFTLPEATGTVQQPLL